MDSRKKVKIRFEMFAKTILDKQGNESYLFSQQAMTDFLDSFNNLAIHDVVQAKPEEVFRWGLFAQKLPDVSRNIDLMHIDGSIRRNFKMTQKELDDLNKWTPRKWRYAT